MTTVGDRLQAYRKQKSLTQSEFADKIGINRVTLSQIERGATTSNDVIERICNTFEISKDWLLSGNGNPPMGIILTNMEKRQSFADNPWEHALVKQLKEENKKLYETIEFLKTLIPRPVGSFLKRPDYAGLTFSIQKVQTGRQSGRDLREAA